MIIFVGVELVIIGICILISKSMINNRRGWAKSFVIGKDDQEVIKKMEKIPREIVSTGKFEIDDTLDGYDVKINTKNGLIVTIEVETSRTHLIYKLVDGEKTIRNKALPRKGAIAMLALTLWIASFWIQLVLGVLLYIATLPI